MKKKPIKLDASEKELVDSFEKGEWKSVQRFHLDPQYQNLLNEIKSHLKKSQLRAAISVNHELIQFYWEVGKLIIERQQQSKWGDKLFDVLSDDLRRSFPDTEGFSKTNLKNMRLFAKNYPNKEFSQALPDQLTWTHHIVLMQSLGKEKKHIKLWYAEKTLENGWSYRELQTQIKDDLYSRQSNHSIKTTKASVTGLGACSGND